MAIDSQSWYQNLLYLIVLLLIINFLLFFYAQSATCITTGAGNPVPSKTATLTVGPQGPILLQDHVIIDEMSHFDRERIPERVVHAKGAGMKIIITYFFLN